MDVMILGGCVVFLAAFLGGVVGFAYGLIALPLLLLVGVELPEVVAVNLLVALVTRVVVVIRRRRDINLSRSALLVLGSLPGVGIGLLVRDAVDAQVIQVAAGVLTILAVVALARLPSAPVAQSTGAAVAAKRLPVTVLAGALGGFLGPTTSLNGIPAALLLTGNRADARVFVADLACYFVAGNAVTLLALGAGGYTIPASAWRLLAIWLPIGLLGNLAGMSLGPRLPAATFRRLTLLIILISGLASTLQVIG